MHIRRLTDCEQFFAGDGSLLRELLHPDKADLKLRYSLAYAVVKPGQTSRPQRLRVSEPGRNIGWGHVCWNQQE